MGATDHRPQYIYCSDPEWCCGHYHPVAIVCAVDRQNWPCATKLAHHTEAEGARVQRWADSRLSRPPMGNR